MKTLRLFLLSLLAIATAVPAGAQVIEDGEAFYIYRNDGNFDGFFYDEVKEIRYSKLDLDSVAHDDYVIQEVVLEDSIHRIPLAAIDSVGFVQPEIKFNPALKNMDELGITPYVTAVSGQVLTVLKTLPTTLRLKKNDVLVGFTGVLEEKGFGGKVTRIVDNGDSWRVHTEKIKDLKDIFVQFITIEQVKTDEQGHAKRRMAGLNGPRKASGGGSLSLFDFSGTIKKEFPVGKGKISLGVNLGVNIDLSVAFNISWSSLFVKSSLRESISVGCGVTASIDKQVERTENLFPSPIESIKFPATCPLFQTSLFPKLFIRAKGEISASLTLTPMEFSARQTVIFDTEADNMMTCVWSDGGEPTDEETSLLDSFDADLTFSGFIQGGLKQEIGIATNDWVSDIFASYIGVDVYAGPKLSGKIEISAKEVMQDGLAALIGAASVSYTKWSVDAEAKAKFSFWGKEPKEQTFFESTLDKGKITLYMTPYISDPIIIDDETYNETGELTFTADIIGNAILPSEVGVDIYDGYRNYVGEIPPVKVGLADGEKTLTGTISGLQRGIYSFIPYIKALGQKWVFPTKQRGGRVAPKVEITSIDGIPIEMKEGQFGPYKTAVLKGTRSEVIVHFKTNAPASCLRVAAPCPYELNGNTVKLKMGRNQTFEEIFRELHIGAYIDYNGDGEGDFGSGDKIRFTQLPTIEGLIGVKVNFIIDDYDLIISEGNISKKSYYSTMGHRYANPAYQNEKDKFIPCKFNLTEDGMISFTGSLDWSYDNGAAEPNIVETFKANIKGTANKALIRTFDYSEEYKQNQDYTTAGSYNYGDYSYVTSSLQMKGNKNTTNASVNYTYNNEYKIREHPYAWDKGKKYQTCTLPDKEYADGLRYGMTIVWDDQGEF